MASIRRPMSPVTRPGTLRNGEACSVASPLSKSSSYAQDYHPPSGGSLSSLFGPLDSLAFVLGVCSQRSSRPLDRSKVKGQVWRRALLHFFICFMIGIFSGLTTFVSMTSSVSINQAFTFEGLSPFGNFHPHDSATRNVMPQMGSGSMNSSSKSKVESRTEEHVKRISDADDNQTLIEDSNLVPRKLLIIVTPTYARPFQTYYLNRLAHTLKHVPPPLLWIVVEMTSQSSETADILRRTGIMYRHLVCNKNFTDIKDRNAQQRNVALSHIETHCLDGIVYFADDDKIYSVDLFEHMRQIRRFGTWMVSKFTENKSKAVLEGPVCNGTQVIGWHINQSSRRFYRFHADMSGFAFNSTILWDLKRWHRPTLQPIRHIDTVKEDFQATSFIEQVVEDESQMEGLPHGCSRVMVWHSRLKSFTSFYPHQWLIKNNLDAVDTLA